MIKAIVLLGLLSTSLLYSAYSAENCTTALNQILRSFDAKIAQTVKLDEHISQRNFIAQFAKKNNVPVFMKKNQIGEEIPVLLVNSTSSKKLSNFIENSYGTNVALQPEHGNDHGLMRTGNFIIDVDAPGYRGYGELHKTGLAWKNFNSYTERRNAGSGVILEVSYLLTPEEKKVIDFYQRIRRSAIFRVKFAFKDFKTEDHPFLLNNGGEHCFIFCKANAVTSHIDELESKLSGLGLKNAETFFEKSEVINALAKVREIVINIPPNELGPTILEDKKVAAIFTGLFPKEINSNEKKYEFIRLAISYEGSRSYNKVLHDLGVTSDYGVNDAINPRASAILVYDEGADPKTFNKAVYSAKGAFTPWPSGVQKPVE